jgi:hypothetical protein
MLHSSQIALGDIKSNMSTDAQRLAELAKLFAFTMDDGREEATVATYRRYLTRFITNGVVVHRCDDDEPEGRGSHEGEVIVDRGFLLVQRETLSDTIFLSCFARDKKNDTIPDLIIPISAIRDVKTKVVVSESGRIVKGRVKIRTHHTLNSNVSMQPWMITIKMERADANRFLDVCDIALEKFPDGNIA